MYYLLVAKLAYDVAQAEHAFPAIRRKAEKFQLRLMSQLSCRVRWFRASALLIKVDGVARVAPLWHLFVFIL